MNEIDGRERGIVIFLLDPPERGMRLSDLEHEELDSPSLYRQLLGRGCVQNRTRSP